MRRLVIIASLALLASLVGWAPAAEARTCPPASIGGRPVATITLGNRLVPVKPVTFRSGQPLDPPATNQAAGISVRNAKLNARKGVTVITWHVRYGTGCEGVLNPLMKMPLGSTFSVAAIGRPATTWQITSRVTIPKTSLRRSWFSNKGPHRMVLFTCTDYRGGVFHKTMAIFAKPVPTPVAAPPAS